MSDPIVVGTSTVRAEWTSKPSAGPNKLLIVIPAYNEEQSIARIIERSLEARQHITSTSPIDEVEITVVSDGSIDRTVEYARTYADRINLIEFETNRGYGAAIKAAWQSSDANLLGFLDADGTCDPRFFADLCTTMEKTKADVVLGSRINSSSRMPLIRRTGNIFFAGLLSIISSKKVRDSASGMRVVRRSSLPKLYPLPDGLHFTPAMSARAVLSGDVRMVEVDMPYFEREGESKLSVGRDGMRFLKVILQPTVLYKPARMLGLLGAICLLVATVLMTGPFLFYVQNGIVLEWMIYRFVVSDLLGVIGVLLFSVAYLVRKIAHMTLWNHSIANFHHDTVSRFVSSKSFLLLPLVLLILGVYLVLPSAVDLVTTGATYEHWSRFIAMSFCVSTASVLLMTKLLNYILFVISERVKYLRQTEAV